MTDISIEPIQSLHIFTKDPKFRGNVHIQSKQGDFEYAIPSKKDIEDGTFTFKNTSQGYGMFSINSDTPGLIMVKSSSGSISARLWTDSISQAVVESPVTIENKKGGISAVLWIAVIVALLIMVAKRKN